MALQPSYSLIDGVLLPRKRGDTSLFEWVIQKETAPGSNTYVALDLTTCSAFKFKLMTKAFAVKIDATAATGAGGLANGALQYAPTNLEANLDPEDHLAECWFTDGSGRVHKVPGGRAYWRQEVGEDVGTP